MLNKLHTKDTMKQQDQGSKDKKEMPSNAESGQEKPNATCMLQGMSTTTKKQGANIDA